MTLVKIHNLPAFLLLLAWASVLTPASAGVIWLRLGTPETPILSADGSVLLSGQLAALELSFADEFGRFLGPASIEALDQPIDGHYLGVVHTAIATDITVVLRLHDSTAGKSATIGPGMLRGDDFDPNLDITTYRLESDHLTWQDTLTLTVETTGAGIVLHDPGPFPPGTTVHLEAVPDPFHEFLHWEGAVPAEVDDQPAIQLLMTSDLTVRAVFGFQVPDFWLQTHFDSISVDVDADPDEDDFTTREEFGYGTDPLAAEAATQNLYLYPGWNLVSLSVLPAAAMRISDLFPSPTAERVLTWDPVVDTHLPAGEGRPLEAFWVWSAVGGPVSIAGQPVVDPVVRIHTGWNQIGSGGESELPGDDSIDGSVYHWDAASQQYRLLAPGSTVPEGKGLLIYSNSQKYLPLPLR